MRIMNFGKVLTLLAAFSPAAVAAQDYSYMPESFEGAEWSVDRPVTVTSDTGKWTTNKNSSSAESAQEGVKSLYLSAKDGIVTPRLAEGAGSLIYYANVTNRQIYVEVSTDNVSWNVCESYKVTSDWSRHVVEINDPAARYLRIRSTSNGGVYLDNLLVTRPDGTDGEGNVIVSNLLLPYFTHDFETRGDYPSSKPAEEMIFNVDGQGEWRYMLAYRNTNSSYIPDGSATGLRMLKGGSYVITPVLTQGVVKVIFDEGRGKRKLTLYTSVDEGATWKHAADIESDVHNTVTINDKTVNRVKLANESGSDADIDNLTVTAYPEGVLPSVVTGAVTAVTPSSAVISGEVTDRGDRRLLSTGVCWSVDGVPVVTGNAVEENPSAAFASTLTGLPAGTEISARAFATSLAGVAYGETVRFKTLAATRPSVTTGDAEIDAERTDELSLCLKLTGRVVDNGGLNVDEAGVCFGESQSPSVTGDKVKAASLDSDGAFTVYLKLKPETQYYLRSYAVNAAGVAYGDEIAYATGSIVVPEYPHNVYYCDPHGDDATADGSASAPFYSLQLAVDIVQPGDTIYMNVGRYNYSRRVNIPVVGEKGSGMIVLSSRDGRAVLDFSGQAIDGANQGIRLTGSYWHFYGLDICNAGDNGLLIERDKPSGGSYADIAANVTQGHDNVIENCAFIRNADTGLQMKNLASRNKVINCDAYYNTDPGHGDADGFAVKISHGDANYFYGCRAWQNSDDGWDQFIKKEGGFPDDITTTLEYCWAFRNGYLESGEKSKGNGNGFKMGSDQGRNNVIMNRCLAFENVNKNFDQNHNTGNMILNNCSSYSSKDTSSKSRYTYRLDEPVAAGHEIRLTNCVAISDGIADRNKSAYAPHSVTGTLVTTDLNTLPADYVSIDWTAAVEPRSEKGELPALDFMKIKPDNKKLIDAGTEVAPYAGECYWAEGIVYNGEAPDLGCFETDGETGGAGEVYAPGQSGSLSIVYARCGLAVLTVEGAVSTDVYTLDIYNPAGQRVLTRKFTGAVTSFYMPDCGAMAILRVTSPGMSATMKVAR